MTLGRRLLTRGLTACDAAGQAPLCITCVFSAWYSSSVIALRFGDAAVGGVSLSLLSGSEIRIPEDLVDPRVRRPARRSA